MTSFIKQHDSVAKKRKIMATQHNKVYRILWRDISVKNLWQQINYHNVQI